MSPDVDAHAARRAELLAPVMRQCQEAGVAVRLGVYSGMFGPPVRAVLCEAEDGSWDAAVTVVRAHRVPEGRRDDGREFGRDPGTGYDLNSSGDLVYEIQVHESDDGPGAHRPLVAFQLCAAAQAAADHVILWVRRAALFSVSPPTPDTRLRSRRERRCFEHREAAAADPAVRTDGVPAHAAADVAALDPASLAWHFPRDRTGRFERRAVVLLAGLDVAAPHLRGGWLTARVAGAGLAVGTEVLVAANQRHRWDATPWLWDRRHAHVPASTRWQVAEPTAAAPIVDLIRRGALPEALRSTGVRVDDQVAALLDGRPTRLFRAQQTGTWVGNLYDGLADAAPWRFAHAYRWWRESRSARRPPSAPVTLFGLGGSGAARKPKVALDLAGDAPMLRVHYTAGSAVLSRSMWTVPADLAARLCGWRPCVASGD